MSNKPLLCLQIAAASLLVTPAVHAHPQLSEEISWWAGLGHPFLGLDHLLVMIAIGLLAAQHGGKRLWQLPFTFLVMMLCGVMIGASGWHLPMIEAGIASSVVVMGVVLMFAIRLPVVPGTLMAGLFAICHGYAHGAEIPLSAGLTDYVLGLMLSTAALHAVGIGSALLARTVQRETWLRLAGFAIGLTGAWLWI